jgi:hypothetical protein
LGAYDYRFFLKVEVEAKVIAYGVQGGIIPIRDEGEVLGWKEGGKNEVD